nr:probable xyloglucan galactosyltransferase GT19 [Tanacetum cinerariifolium]
MLMVRILEIKERRKKLKKVVQQRVPTCNSGDEVSAWDYIQPLSKGGDNDGDEVRVSRVWGSSFLEMGLFDSWVRRVRGQETGFDDVCGWEWISTSPNVRRSIKLECEAKKQYAWHFLKDEYDEFSVMIPKEDVVFRGVSVVEETWELFGFEESERCV